MSDNDNKDPADSTAASNGHHETSATEGNGSAANGSTDGAGAQSKAAASGNGNAASLTAAERISAVQRSGTEFAKEWVETPAPTKDTRYLALRNFAISITVFNLIGFPLLGFEQPFLWPFIALATAYSTEIGLEVLAAWAYKRRPAFLGRGPRGLFEFLLPAHITGLAFNFLTFAHDKLWPVIFGIVVAVGTKWVLRAKINGKMRHFMNPSNFGVVVCFLVFPMIAVAPPYHFTEYITGPADALIVLGLLMTGTLLNAKLTLKMPLIMAWVGAFALQAIVRGLVEPNVSILAGLSMMTGLAFVLFTNYMVTDPGTTPSGKKQQIMFGASVGIMYGVVTALHISYGLFIALVIVCGARGVYWWARGLAEWWQNRGATPSAPEQPVVADDLDAEIAREPEPATEAARS
ncbi:enediyne biosynthesis protein [Nocardia abscessus]|uniref:Enediyne biosynthesis protein n=1 Tax=Nocardia abscessus TaxID=120957 RepID=A0ABS0C6M0_9NOCA|nr:enediyne biosynthesis protein [Nocardia abscessus]MBF6225153.1 enediyne biosynthesis protein [Nocardia abscessus]